MGDEAWDEKIPRSRGHIDLDQAHIDLGYIVELDKERQIICADCGTPAEGGIVCHLKPVTYEARYKGEIFFLERHIGVQCGCAFKRHLTQNPPGPKSVPQPKATGAATLEEIEEVRAGREPKECQITVIGAGMMAPGALVCTTHNQNPKACAQGRAAWLLERQREVIAGLEKSIDAAAKHIAIGGLVGGTLATIDRKIAEVKYAKKDAEIKKLQGVIDDGEKAHLSQRDQITELNAELTRIRENGTIPFVITEEAKPVREKTRLPRGLSGMKSRSRGKKKE